MATKLPEVQNYTSGKFLHLRQNPEDIEMTIIVG